MAESLKIVDILDNELGKSVVDYWRLTLHTPTLDVNFEGYGDIPWNLIKTGLSEIEGINSVDEVLSIPADQISSTYWSGFVAVDNATNWVVLDLSSKNIASWRTVPGLGHKVEFLIDVAHKTENLGKKGSQVPNSRA